MKAKQKAKELVKKFEQYFPIKSGTWWCRKQAKQCALICVDEQIDFITDWTPIDWNVRKIMVDELQEIKQEINKL